jgi:hypothetical protein
VSLCGMRDYRSTVAVDRDSSDGEDSVAGDWLPFFGVSLCGISKLPGPSIDCRRRPRPFRRRGQRCERMAGSLSGVIIRSDLSVVWARLWKDGGAPRQSVACVIGRNKETGRRKPARLACSEKRGYGALAPEIPRWTC